MVMPLIAKKGRKRKGADQWARMSFEAHPNGVNAVAWCPVAGVMI